MWLPGLQHLRKVAVILKAGAHFTKRKQQASTFTPAASDFIASGRAARVAILLIWFSDCAVKGRPYKYEGRPGLGCRSRFTATPR